MTYAQVILIAVIVLFKISLWFFWSLCFKTFCLICPFCENCMGLKRDGMNKWWENFLFLMHCTFKHIVLFICLSHNFLQKHGHCSMYAMQIMTCFIFFRLPASMPSSSSRPLHTLTSFTKWTFTLHSWWTSVIIAISLLLAFSFHCSP